MSKLSDQDINFRRFFTRYITKYITKKITSIPNKKFGKNPSKRTASMADKI